MERSIYPLEMLEQLMCPAFTVHDGIITQVNRAAQQRQISENTPVTDLISIGGEEYAEYSGGKLSLTLSVCGAAYSATVTATDNCQLFCLSPDYSAPELRALALAAQQLREPLSSAMSSTDELLPQAAVQTDPQMRMHIAQINRSLHQLLRAISNMSDAANYKSSHTGRMELCDAVAFFHEILDKAANLASLSGRTVQYRLPSQSITCLLNKDKLERAVLNLISNAMRHSPDDSTIEAKLHRSGNRLIFSVQDHGKGVSRENRSQIFDRFLREPGLDDGHSGIGLGMTIVCTAAAAHGGAVLMDQPDGAGARFTMTISIRTPGNSALQSPVTLPFDYAGERDHFLIELSDVLSETLFEKPL